MISYIYSKKGYSGGVSEWFKELVLKTSDSERNQGFESLPLRHLNFFMLEVYSVSGYVIIFLK